MENEACRRGRSGDLFSPHGNDRFFKYLRLPALLAQVTRQAAKRALAHLGVRRIVVGHCPTKCLAYSIGMPHPFYGDAVIAVDTGISRYYGGKLSALELTGGIPVPHYFERGGSDLPLTGLLRSKYMSIQNRLSGLAGPPGN